MKVTLLYNLYGKYAGKDGTVRAGAVIDLPDAIAAGLIKAKKADPYPPPTPPAQPTPVKE